MGSPPKNERWPLAKRIRHVWVGGSGLLTPRQGLVIEWHERSAEWTALVAYADESKHALIVDRFGGGELMPVRSDPNQRGSYDGPEESPANRVRHVWVANSGRMMPRQGLILEWRQRASGYTALVAYVEEFKRTLIVEWFRAGSIWAVASRPDRPTPSGPAEEPFY